MKVIGLGLVAALSIGACVPRADLDRLDRRVQADIDDIFRTSWSTGCQDTQRDAYGSIIDREKCWAMISSSNRDAKDGFSISGTLFEIDENGPRMKANHRSDRLCEPEPRRIAIDGRRIDHLPPRSLIEATLSGTRLTRERSREWPYCNLQNESADITGARAAYNEMIEKWEARRAVRP